MLLRTARAISRPLSSLKFALPLVSSQPRCSFSSMERFSKKLKARKRMEDPDEIKLEEPERRSDQHTSEDTQNQPKEGFIPPNFVVKHLVWPATGSSVLLLGVDRRDSLHASFLYDIIIKSTVELISIQLSPDEPYFIRTSSNYRSAWKKFILGNFDSKFFLNPNPRYMADIILDQERIKMFMEGPVMHTEDTFEVGATFIYSRTGALEPKQVVDCMLSPVLYSYNNPEKRINIVVNDVPILVQREYLARMMSKKDLKDLLEQYIDSIADKENKFDPTLLQPEAFVHPRIAYITETLRQACYVNKKIIAIVDYNFTDLIEDEWRGLGKELRSFTSCLTPKLPENNTLNYADYIEKHVLLDLIQEPFVAENFIKHKSFPFAGKDTIGMEISKNNIFTIWDHHYRKNAGKVNKRTPTMDDFKTGSKLDNDLQEAFNKLEEERGGKYPSDEDR